MTYFQILVWNSNHKGNKIRPKLPERERKKQGEQLRVDTIISVQSIKNTSHTQQSALSLQHYDQKNNKQGCEQSSSDGSTEATRSSSENWDNLLYYPAISQSLQLVQSTEYERCIDWHSCVLKLPYRPNAEFPLNYTRMLLHHKVSTAFSPKPLSLKEIHIIISAFIHEKFWNSWHRLWAEIRLVCKSGAGGCRGWGVSLNWVWWLHLRSSLFHFSSCDFTLS